MDEQVGFCQFLNRKLYHNSCDIYVPQTGFPTSKPHKKEKCKKCDSHGKKNMQLLDLKSISPKNALKKVINIFAELKCGATGNKTDMNNFFHAYYNTWKNVPRCCTEPFILKGYLLSGMPWWYYLQALWIPNNEMLNIWTHLIPFCYFMWMLYEFSLQLNLMDAWPLFLITICSVILMGCSFLAHMFHSRSCFHHRLWFLVDYIGITAFAFGSTISHYFACAEVSYYNRIGWYNLVILTLICCAGYFCSAVSKVATMSGKQGRQLKLWANGFGYFHGVLPLFYRFYLSNDPDIYYHKLHIFCMLLAPIWYASDVPQRCWPGHFDIVGHSHQIFHVFGALTCYFDICAVYVDVTSSNGSWVALTMQEDYPTMQAVCIFTLAVFAFCIALLQYLMRFLPPLKVCKKSTQCVCASFCCYNFPKLTLSEWQNMN